MKEKEIEVAFEYYKNKYGYAMIVPYNYVNTTGVKMVEVFSDGKNKILVPSNFYKSVVIKDVAECILLVSIIINFFNAIYKLLKSNG